jgi:hypothetical protein
MKILGPEREVNGFIYQTYLYSYREFLLIQKNWKDLLLHYIQIIFSALFLGCFFYNRPYKGVKKNITISITSK